MSSRFSNAPGEADVFSLARYFTHRLEEFLFPFLLRLSGGRAPAGTKRISNLLRSKKWQASAVTDYQAEKAAGLVLGKQDEAAADRRPDLRLPALIAGGEAQRGGRETAQAALP